jgi:hypothetical protein
MSSPGTYSGRTLASELDPCPSCTNVAGLRVLGWLSQVVTDHERIQKRKYLLTRLSSESASEYEFEYNGTRISVADYYQRERQIQYGPVPLQ